MFNIRLPHILQYHLQLQLWGDGSDGGKRTCWICSNLLDLVESLGLPLWTVGLSLNLSYCEVWDWASPQPMISENIINSLDEPWKSPQDYTHFLSSSLPQCENFHWTLCMWLDSDIFLIQEEDIHNLVISSPSLTINILVEVEFKQRLGLQWLVVEMREKCEEEDYK